MPPVKETEPEEQTPDGETMIDPETGEVFPYSRTPDGFTLSYRNGEHTITTGSKPDY